MNLNYNPCKIKFSSSSSLSLSLSLSLFLSLSLSIIFVFLLWIIPLEHDCLQAWDSSNYLESENCKSFVGFLLGIFSGFQSILCSNSAHVWFGNKGTKCSWSVELQRKYNGRGGEWVGKSHWWMKKAQKRTRAGSLSAAQQRNKTTKNMKSIQNQTKPNHGNKQANNTCSDMQQQTRMQGHYNKNQSPGRSKSPLQWWSCGQDLLAQLQYVSHWVFVPQKDKSHPLLSLPLSRVMRGMPVRLEVAVTRTRCLPTRWVGLKPTVPWTFRSSSTWSTSVGEQAVSAFLLPCFLLPRWLLVKWVPPTPTPCPQSFG